MATRPGRRFRNAKGIQRSQVSVAPSRANSPTLGGMPNVEYIRPELAAVLGKYRRIEDCIGGTEAVKRRREEYLPRPNSADVSEENLDRYDAYVARAVFYAVTYRTVKALVGQIFLRDPQTKLPSSFDAIVTDANGENVSLNQIADLCATHTLSLGRAGLLVDYSTAPNGVTLKQKNSGDYRPVIMEYSGAVIRNWRKARRGSRMVYTLIVIAEDYTITDDGFEAKSGMQYKVLRLVSADVAQSYLTANNSPDDYGNMYDNAVLSAQSDASDVYVMEVWRSTTPGAPGGTFDVHEVYYPKGADGKFLNEIPFQFVGSEQNDDSVDQPPVEAMSEINLAHYRNSADYEESVFLVGQPTPYVSGVTAEWNENVLKGQIQLGSRGVIVLPNGGTAGLLQADANGLASEAMKMKERQMVALGAKLVEQRETQRTATEAEMESTADTSILAKIAGNVSVAVEWALKTACKFTGDDPDAVSYVLNKEFDLTKMPADARQQLLLEFEGGMISFSEMRANLRRGGIATLDDVAAKAQIQADQDARNAADILQAQKMNAINLKPVQDGGGGDPPVPGSTGNTPGNTPQRKPGRTGAKPGSKPSPQPAGT